MKSFVVIGLGRFGSAVAKTIAETEADLLVIDQNEDRVNLFKDIVPNAIIADAKDERVLDEIGIQDFDVAVVAIGEDIQSSVLVTMLAKDAGVPQVITKAVDKNHYRLLEKIGADRVVLPEVEMGRKIAESLIFENISNVVDITENIEFAEVKVCSRKMNNRVISEIDDFTHYDLNISYVKHINGKVEIASGDTRLMIGDSLFVIGRPEDIQKLSEQN
ncbi:potassium channel family protein [Lactococcus garvieae]